jgi:hypothetical protein
LFCNALIIFLFIHNADVKTCFLCFFFMDPIELILHRRKRAGKLLGFTVVGDAVLKRRKEPTNAERKGGGWRWRKPNYFLCGAKKQILLSSSSVFRRCKKSTISLL